jgi:hypothetical protein
VLPLNLKTTTIIDSVTSLDVDYTDPESGRHSTFVLPTKLVAATSDKFQLKTETVYVTVSGVNRLKIPGSFSVHLTKDGEVIASKGFFQPVEPDQCPTCVENAIVRFDFELPLAKITGGKLGIWVEPANKSFVGDRFPSKLMGNPTVEVHFPLTTE